ncbi:polar amino acid ABC transporter permease [Burkholderia sp. SG-MS1]|uniref:amino acid ABC transporter permease n=1 Tax=Paraburkholderia sp. SG-MS1 TaxID=2023741 RepID=UPI001445C291|nr:amino acid ABC transporter permease [Paraburkholderia sp. SG-MS1]NKJ47468.1 polar amino acid ABC transporter permease [Paraburkholderia sp. SG-MS1]
MIANFLIIWQQRDAVLAGLLNTVILLAVSGVASLVLGALLMPMLMSQNKAVSRVAAVYVDAMRCAPFLLFVYLIYFGLPTLGIRMSNWSAGALALILYNAAYMGELLRGAWVELPASLIESGKAFGFRGFTLLRRIILPPVMLRATPLVGNQLIQIVKDSAFLTVIAVSELTHEMTGIQATYFIPFAAFVAAVLLYWCICLAIEAGTGMLNKFAEERRA